MTRVVIAHDFMEIFGGAERVTAEMAYAFPDAPVYALLGRHSVAERMGVADRFRPMLGPRPRILRHYRMATPLLPLLADSARLPPADVLLTSSYAFAHRFRTANRAPQVCYCHSPLRFAWTMTESYRNELARGRVSSFAFDRFSELMSRSDRRASTRVTRYLTQSPYVANQIQDFYGRRAEVIGAPIDCDVFRPAGDGRGGDDYYLFCGRLIEPYKQAGTTVEAFRRLPHRLIVAGDGPALSQLRRDAPANVEFTGHLNDADLVPLMQGCRALVFPSRDDFGLIPVEVMACGRPVIAYNQGGAAYTVRPGVTGELFAEQTPNAIAFAVSSFDPDAYDPAEIRRHACHWDKGAFRSRLVDTISDIAA